MNEKILETAKQMNLTEDQIRLLEIKMILLEDQIEEELQDDKGFEEVSIYDLIQKENENE